MATRRTPWSDAMRDRTDNVLVISSGDLQASENNAEFADPHAFYDDVTGHGPVRDGSYLVQEVLGGSPYGVFGRNCAWNHARNGDQDNQLWNGTTTDPGDTSGPVCRSLGSGLADAATGASVFFEFIYGTDPIFSAPSVKVITRHQSRWLRILPLRDNLGPRGVLSLGDLDPAADGVPTNQLSNPTLDIEWETPYIEIVKVEATGDMSGRRAAGTGDPLGSEEITIAFHREAQPQWSGTDWVGAWIKDFPAIWDGNSPDLLFDYLDDDPVWYEVTGIVAGADGFDDAAAADEAPDELATYGMSLTYTETVAPGLGLGTSDSDVAWRFTLRSPRYRWVWDVPTVVRQFPRDDSRGLSSAPRLFPPSKSRRVVGGYPGGSGA